MNGNLNHIAPPPTFREAFRVWLKIGFINFGGPAGQIALMHKLLVEERKWISETRFLHALNYCMLLPGPEAQQLATYIGWLLHKTWGGIVAGLLFILPGFLLLVAISVLYSLYGELTVVQGLLFGLQAATLAIVIEAVLRVGKKALKNRLMWGIAAAAFVGIFFFGAPFPLIVLTAALLGFFGGRTRPDLFLQGKKHDDPDEAPLPEHAHPSWRRDLKVLIVCALLWFLPVLLLFAFAGAQHVFTQEALFFSKMAVVTFGGAYAVLAYMAQEAVQRYAWLSPAEMIQGLALAETTPGPLILVLTYVGFLGGFHYPGGLHPVLAGVIGATISTWVTFVPCFLWILLGAPYIERLRGNQQLSAALAAITAAVVGVILNLSIWFGLHVLFHEVGQWQSFGLRVAIPNWQTLNWSALLLAGGAMLALLKFHVGMIRTLLACATLGLVLRFAGI